MPTVSRDKFVVRLRVEIADLERVLNERAAMRGWRLIAIIPRPKAISETVNVVWAKTERLTVADPVDLSLSEVFSPAED